MIHVTIWQDAAGNLHIFKGANVLLNYLNKYLAKTVSGKESDLFIQHEQDIIGIKDTLSRGQLNVLNGGWKINAKLDNLYFNS